MRGDTSKANMAAEASESSASDTLEHVQRAAAKNGDAEVAGELREAVISADTTVARVGWLRRILTRMFPLD